jgi:hypothetical protein
MKFELNSLPRNCSKEEMIAEIRRVDKIVNKDVLTQKDFNKHGKMSSSGIKNRFGDWEKALIAAGLGHEYSGITVSDSMRYQKGKNLSEIEVLSELKRIAGLLNQNFVKQDDIKKYSKIIVPSTVYYKFGSWAKGVKKADLQDSPGYRRKYSEVEYFENLLNAWTYYGRQPSYGEIDKTPSKISAGAYENRFGTWRKALEAFVAKMNTEEPVLKHGAQEKLVARQKHIINKPEKTIIKRTYFTEGRREIGLSLRYKVLNRDKFKCVRCGGSPATNHACCLHVDHKIPFSKGGKTVLENLQTLCEDCNLGKGNRHLE